MDKPIAWYDPSNGMVSTDKDSPLFTPLGQVWGLYAKEEAKDEPYALEASMFSNDRVKVDPVTGNVSIGTPQRTWVGLTDEDEIDWDGGDLKSLIKAIEKALKERNT